MSFEAQNFPGKKKFFFFTMASVARKRRSLLLAVLTTIFSPPHLLLLLQFLESLQRWLLLRSWPMHRRWLPCRLLPPPMQPKIGPSSFTVIFFSTTSSQNGNRRSKLSFSSFDSHFCVCFCFYSDSDWFLWRSDSTSLAEFVGLIFDFGVLWRRSTSFSGKRLWFFSLFIVLWWRSTSFSGKDLIQRVWLN